PDGGGDGVGPLRCGGDVQREGQHRIAVEVRHRPVQFVDEHIAGGDPVSVLQQPAHDGGALPAGGAGHQRDAFGGVQWYLPDEPGVVEVSGRSSRGAVASARCAAAPRRNACPSEASVMTRKPRAAMARPAAPSPAWIPVTRPADAAACWIRSIVSSTSVTRPAPPGPWPIDSDRSAGPT